MSTVATPSTATTVHNHPHNPGMDKYGELARCVENIEKDAQKFFLNGNKAAGTRARKHLQELKQLAQDLRVLIQDTKNEKARGPVPGGTEDTITSTDAPVYEDEAGAF